ncbi:GAF and ANTAR domain-containing protein [Actinoplanes xinjiangensis]|uniref:GAF and ANTAR domain-containing protein n=1 Tax=Actinoplanes xinjiangensis TaxID=512350 RepID=UPI001941903B|nr:GAF and ANTAR domain-containing protein [Actinoplanes xinjiangensis]
MDRLVAAYGPDVDELCRACVAHFPDVQGAGVAVMTGTAQQVRYASDAVSERVEQLQLLLGEGPCRDAFDMGTPVLADDLQAAAWRERWPAFAGAALQAGARAVFALPLRAGTLGVGVLDLYRDSPGVLAGQDLADALDFAAAVTDLLLAEALPDGDSSDDYDAGTGSYLAQRAVVHQATGMISVQLEVGLEEAFARLRAHAFAAERELDAVAADVVARRLRFDELDGDPALGAGDRDGAR